MKTAFDPGEVLALPLMANLATMSLDGPRNAPVWFLWEDGVMWMLGGEGNASTRRLVADPRCAVEVVEFDNAGGVLRHVGLRGEAEVGPMDPALFRRLLAKYLGPDPGGWNPWFIEEVARIEDAAGRLLRLDPASVFTNDVSFFRTGPELASRTIG